MSQLPTAIPNLLPEDEYKFKIVGIKEFSSKYDEGSYYKMYFLVKNSEGETFNFSLAVNAKMQRYRDILGALGVVADEQGFLHPPDDVVGMKFQGRIFQRPMKNDPNKTVNDVKNLRPMTAAMPKAELPEGEDPGEDSEIPF